MFDQIFLTFGEGLHQLVPEENRLENQKLEYSSLDKTDSSTDDTLMGAHNGHNPRMIVHHPLV